MEFTVKIECIIKRVGGSRVNFDAWPNENMPESAPAPAADYHFKALDKNDPQSPHVAEVTEPVHIARLLSLSHCYRVHLDDGESPSEFTQPVVPVKPRAKPAPPPPPAGVDTARVDALRALSVKDLKKSINTFDEPTLRAALAAEQERKDDKPRATWIEVVEAHLGNGDEEEQGDNS